MVRVLGFALVAGCTGPGGNDVSLDGSPTEEEVDCLGADTFVTGISAVTSAGRVVAITSATPTPPDVGDNTWTLEVSDDAGPVPLLDVAVRPFMPLHNHGLTPPTYTAEETAAGSYELPTFDLIMPGLWEFRVEIDAAQDEALFKFCAEG